MASLWAGFSTNSHVLLFKIIILSSWIPFYPLLWIPSTFAPVFVCLLGMGQITKVISLSWFTVVNGSIPVDMSFLNDESLPYSSVFSLTSNSSSSNETKMSPIVLMNSPPQFTSQIYFPYRTPPGSSPTCSDLPPASITSIATTSSLTNTSAPLHSSFSMSDSTISSSHEVFHPNDSPARRGGIRFRKVWLLLESGTGAWQFE